MEKNLSKEYSPQGNDTIGCDECGTGCWAGPAMVCAVYIPPHVRIEGLADSKSFSKSQVGVRDDVSELIRRTPGVVFCVTPVPTWMIDEHGLSVSVIFTMGQAVRLVQRKVTRKVTAIFDGLAVPLGVPRGISMVKADSKVESVMAASIIAKSHRDRMMKAWAELPEFRNKWRFDLHKGYGTPLHRAEVAKFGVSRLHRRSVAPVAEYLNLHPE